MKKQYFGTDGIRGRVNEGRLNPEFLVRVGQAVGVYFLRGEYRHFVIVGKDTRLSGYLFENSLIAGFLSVGMDVVIAGPIPTPAVAMLTKSLRSDVGVMISASHNHYSDNGMKFFGPLGFKLTDEDEIAIEELINSDLTQYLVADDKIGRARRISDVAGRYIEYLKFTFSRGKTLRGLKIVIDAANGATYRIAPKVLWELGAEVVEVGVSPNGLNINLDCGSMNTDKLVNAVLENNADIGFALDGDGDRVRVVDYKGRVIDGDIIFAIIAKHWHKKGYLSNSKVVVTHLSNMALDKYLKKFGVIVCRSDVGDRNVVNMMMEEGSNLGGENSGHFILGDYSTSGDGIVSLLQILSILLEYKGQKEICDIFSPFVLYPQISQNIESTNKHLIEHKDVVGAIADSMRILGDNGRVIVRASGTEPVIRVVVEGKNMSIITDIADELVKTIQNTLDQSIDKKKFSNKKFKTIFGKFDNLYASLRKRR